MPQVLFYCLFLFFTSLTRNVCSGSYAYVEASGQAGSAVFVTPAVGVGEHCVEFYLSKSGAGTVELMIEDSAVTVSQQDSFWHDHIIKVTMTEGPAVPVSVSVTAV